MPATKPDEGFPPGYKFDDGIVYGMRVEGLFEIKFHSPKDRNAITGMGQRRLGILINQASQDPAVKVILLHGGKYYGAGNNLKGLMKGLEGDEKRTEEVSRFAAQATMIPFLTAFKNCQKPIVAVVRGGCHGIHFTPLTMVDFIYCGADAMFSVPFMKSF